VSRIALDIETEPFDVAARKFAYNVLPKAIPYSLDGISASTIFDLKGDEVDVLKKHLAGCDKLVFHNSKFDIPKFEILNFTIPYEKIEDTLLMSSLLHQRGQNGLKYLARKFLLMEMSSFDKSLYENKESLKNYADKDALATYNLYEILRGVLNEQGLYHVYKDLELPLIPAFIELEKNGILLDLNKVKQIGKDLNQKKQSSLLCTQKKLGSVFNPTSSKQLKKYLYEDQKFIPFKYTKKGQPSVVVDVLKKFHSQSSSLILLEIINYLESSKSLSNQIFPILKRVDSSDFRLRCEYNQIGTDTGRTSAKNPNLQGIPKEGIIRQCFLASSGHKLVCADFAQQEPRILAALSKDPRLIAIISSGQDLYREIAGLVLKKNSKDVSDDERKVAKVLTLACLYGQQEKGVAESLGISTYAAKKVLRDFYKNFSGLVSWKNEVLTFLYLNSYVKTPLGRRRRFNLNVGEANDFNKIERESINAVIQGTAADVSKFVLLQIFNSKRPTWKLLAFVHDEYLIEVPESDIEEAEIFLAQMMSSKIPWLDAVFVAEVGSGNNWAEAKANSKKIFPSAC